MNPLPVWVDACCAAWRVCRTEGSVTRGSSCPSSFKWSEKSEREREREREREKQEPGLVMDRHLILNIAKCRRHAKILDGRTKLRKHKTYCKPCGTHTNADCFILENGSNTVSFVAITKLSCYMTLRKLQLVCPIWWTQSTFKEDKSRKIIKCTLKFSQTAMLKT